MSSKTYAKIVFNRDSSVKECQKLVALLKGNPLISSINVAIEGKKVNPKLHEKDMMTHGKTLH